MYVLLHTGVCVPGRLPYLSLSDLSRPSSVLAFCCCLVIISWLAGGLDTFFELLIYSRFLLRPGGEPRLSLLEDLTATGLKTEKQESAEGPVRQRRA